MAQGFESFSTANRRTLRAPTNPLDRATIFSIYPKAITEIKPTVQPGVFHIEAGTFDSPTVLIVEPSSWWREIDVEQPLLEIPIPSITMADSIVKDYCNGLLAHSGDAQPGIFYLPGKLTVSDLKKDYKGVLDKAKLYQDNWYKALVRMGDIMWSRTNGNPIAISEDMRMAAKEIGVNRDWLANYQSVELVRCVACGNLRDPRYPVCATCKSIDHSHPASKDLKFAV